MGTFWLYTAVFHILFKNGTCLMYFSPTCNGSECGGYQSRGFQCYVILLMAENMADKKGSDG